MAEAALNPKRAPKSNQTVQTPHPTQDDEDDELEEWQKPPWYRRPRVLMHIAAFSLALLLVVAGMCIPVLVDGFVRMPGQGWVTPWAAAWLGGGPPVDCGHRVRTQSTDGLGAGPGLLV